jgi:L-lactate dehydrogenase complex protein LldG
MSTSVHSEPVTPAGEAALDRLIEQLAARAGAVGVKTHRFSMLDEVAALAADLAATQTPAGRVVIAPGFDTAQPALRERLAAHGAAVGAIDPADPAASFAGVTVGISEAVCGVAETGTLVVADGLADRLVRMLAPIHIVILAATTVLPDLDATGALLRDVIGAVEQPARYVTFITGPSRTADIEMSLTVGAHGPAELHIAVLGA